MLVAICIVIPKCMRLLYTPAHIVHIGTVTEILHLKDNGVTTLIFWGHVTSSVTWPFDSRGSTSYGWSTVTMHLFGTAMEIWLFEVLPERLFQGVRTLRHQDSSAPRHFGTNAMVPICPDRSAPVPNCPNDTSAPVLKCLMLIKQSIITLNVAFNVI